MKIPFSGLTVQFILKPLIENWWKYFFWKTRHNPISITDSECKAPGVQILRQDDGDVEEDEKEEDTMDAGLDGDQDMVYFNIVLWNKAFL